MNLTGQACLRNCLALDITSGDVLNYIWSWMFDRSKPKIVCSSSITKGWTGASSFDVRKNNVRVCSKSNLVNLVKVLLDSKFDVRSLEAKNRVFEFDHQKMNMVEFGRCSKADVRVRSMFNGVRHITMKREKIKLFCL